MYVQACVGVFVVGGGVLTLVSVVVVLCVSVLVLLCIVVVVFCWRGEINSRSPRRISTRASRSLAQPQEPPGGSHGGR